MCTAAGDKASLAIGMTGLVIEHCIQGRIARGVAAGIRTDGAARVDRRSDPDRGAGVPGDLRQGSTPVSSARPAAVVADGHRPGRRRPRQGRPSLSDRRWRSRLHRGLWPGGGLGRPGWRRDLRRRRGDGPKRRPGNLRPGRRLEATFREYRYGVLRLPMTPRCARSRRRCRSPNDPATISRLAFARVRCWVSRWCIGTPLRTVTADWSCWRRSATCGCASGHYLSELPVIDVYLARGEGQARRPRRCHTADAQSRRRSASRGTAAVVGRCLRPAFWWRRCWSRGAEGDVAEAQSAIDRLANAAGRRRFGDARHHAAAAARAAGPGPRRRRRLPGLGESLSRDGEIAWLRRTHRDWAEAMTMTRRRVIVRILRHRVAREHQVLSTSAVRRMPFRLTQRSTSR